MGFAEDEQQCLAVPDVDLLHCLCLRAIHLCAIIDHDGVASFLGSSLAGNNV
jgi:hypothetical protein